MPILSLYLQPHQIKERERNFPFFFVRNAFSRFSNSSARELATAKVKPKGNVFAMLYNAPFTPWFMRRNEVAIEVEPEHF
jgi:hypothetical protein